MQGASPLASPRLNPGGTGFSFEKQCPKGGLSPGLPAEPAAAVPGGGRRGWLPSEPATNLPFCPHPPDPLPNGKGETFYFISPGAGAPGTPAAEPGRHGLFLWKTVPQGGLVPGVAGWLCCTGARGGLVFRLACLPCHLFTIFPPSPRPPSRREGGDQGYFMQGAPPLASPRLNPGGTGFSFEKQCPKGGLVPGVVGWLCCAGARGGACLSPRLPTMPFVCRFSPIPPTPFPTGRGRPRLFHARGFAPCIPGVKSLTALTNSAVSVPGGGLVPGVAGWLYLAGTQRGCPPGLPERCPGQACHGTGHEPAFMKIIGKSSWGFGGFFQEAPNASPFYSFSNAARVQAGFKTHSRSG